MVEMHMVMWLLVCAEVSGLVAGFILGSFVWRWYSDRYPKEDPAPRIHLDEHEEHLR